MSTNVLLHISNKLGKRGLPSILSLFHNLFAKFTNTEAGIVWFFLSYDIKTTLELCFWSAKHNILSYDICNTIMTVIT